MIESILFVCLGNICRSPLAEGLCQTAAASAGITLTIDSAGTSGWHTGDPPDPRCIVAAREHGFDISDQRSRVIRSEDFEAFDLILCMDEQNLEDVERRRPAGSTTPVRLLTEFRTDCSPRDVPDPYYTSQFNPVIKIIEDCMPGLLDYTARAQ